MHEISQNGGYLIMARVSGKLTTKDSRALSTAWQRVIDERDSVPRRFIKDDPEVWQPGVASDDLQCEVSSPDPGERVATMGEQAQEAWLNGVSSLFAPERPRSLNLDGGTEYWVRAG